jgi:ligand-binding sensor domain-containing protein
MLFRKTLLFISILLPLIVLLSGCVSSKQSLMPEISSNKVSPTFQNNSPYPSAFLPSASPSKAVPSPSGSTANMPVSSNVSGAWTLFNIGYSRYFAIYGKELWIETEDEIAIWNTTNNNIRKIPFTDFPILLKITVTSDTKPISDISSLIIDNTGRLWIGTYHSGLCSYDGHKWQIFKEPGIGNEVEVIFKDKEGKIWIGSEKGISVFNGQKWEWLNIDMSRAIYDITQDAKGHIWYFTDQARTYHLVDGNVSIPSSKFPDQEMWAIAGDKQGYVWVATSSGIYRNGYMVEPQVNDWKSFTTKEGLADNIVNSIFCDNKGNLWFATARGITCLSGNDWKTYNPFGTQFGYGNIAQDDDGDIWFGCGLNGICRYNPN